MNNNISEKYEVFHYISTLANSYTPAKTIYVCAPDCAVRSYEAAEQFAKDSGWLKIAEADGAVLILPIAKHGWQAESPALLAELYQETRQKFRSKNGDSIPGREGFIWCWETLIYLAGYEEGAVYAGNVVVTNPNRFAGVALVNGVPDNYLVGAAPSDHWLVLNVSKDYQIRNHDIPVCLWMFGTSEHFADQALAYFSESNRITAPAEAVEYDGIRAKRYRNRTEEAHQIRVSVGNFSSAPALSKIILERLFNEFIRWKNSPDGTLKPHLCKSAFYSSDRYIHDEVIVKDTRYEFHTYLPEGTEKKAAAGLPVVFSVHGRGEPAWIFSTKNGWERLADETGEFIVVLPDSPQNMWWFDRDREVFRNIIDRLYTTYSIDRTRVYLTGFSNGGMMTRWMGIHEPELFAAISPWNAPSFVMPPVNSSFAESFEEIFAGDYELPCFIYAGDNDEKVPLWDDLDIFLENMLKVNKCSLRIAESRNPMKFTADIVQDVSNYYTKENKYTDGDRFRTYLYKNIEGQSRVGFTLMKNMPHGAVYDQSRAAWTFLKRFSRTAGSKKVVDSETRV